MVRVPLHGTYPALRMLYQCIQKDVLRERQELRFIRKMGVVMVTLLYADSPMQPLDIARQRLSAGFAYEKHHWLFPSSTNRGAVPVFEYTSSGEARRERYLLTHDDFGGAVIPLRDTFLPDALPQPMLHFTALYELPLSDSRIRTEEAVARSLVGRWVVGSPTPLYLVFSNRLLTPRQPAPASVRDLMAYVAGRDWDGTTSPGILSLTDEGQRRRALLAFGWKGYTDLYLLATTESPASFTPPIQRALQRLTEARGTPAVTYSAFHALVQACEWVLTSHNALPEQVPYCFYSPVDLRPALRALDSQTCHADDRQVMELPLGGVKEYRREGMILSSSAVVPLPVSAFLALERRENPTTLSLAWTGVSALDELAQVSTLRHLDLDGTLVEEVTPLRHLPALESLSLRDVQLESLAPLAEIPTLRSLSLSRLPWQGLSVLAQLPNLERLELDGASEVSSLSQLPDLPGLTFLSLARTSLHSLEGIERFPALEMLILDETPLEDIAPLAHHPTLRTLSLANSKVQTLGPLATLSLHELDASALPVEDWSPIRQVTTLRALTLRESSLADAALLQPLMGLETLILAKSSVADMAPLGTLSRLQTLDLSYTPIRNIRPLAALESLRSLALHQTEVEDASPLAALVQLETLRLDGTPLTNLEWIPALQALRSLAFDALLVRDLAPLTKLPALTELELDGWDEPDGSRLAPFAHLTRLSLHASALTETGWLRGWTALKVLHLEHSTVSDLEALAGHPSLEELNLRRTQVTSLTPLAGLPLRQLYLDYTPISDPTPLRTIPTLERLSLRGTEVEDMRVLAELPRLRWLDIGQTSPRHMDTLLTLPLGLTLALSLRGVEPALYRELDNRFKLIPDPPES